MVDRRRCQITKIELAIWPLIIENVKLTSRRSEFLFMCDNVTDQTYWLWLNKIIVYMFVCDVKLRSQSVTLKLGAHGGLETKLWSPAKTGLFFRSSFFQFHKFWKQSVEVFF